MLRATEQARDVCPSTYSTFARWPLVIVFAAAFFLAGPAYGQLMARPTVIEDVRIQTMDGQVIERGTIVIRGSRVVAAGPDVEIPRRALRIDGSGMVATPGFIDTNSTLAMPGGAAGGNNPVATGADAFDRYDLRAIRQTLGQGVTAVYVGPTRHSGFGPAGSIIRLQPQGGAFGEPIEPRTMLSLNLRSDADPVQRLQVLDSVRGMLRSAREHEEALELYEEQLEKYLAAIETSDEEETEEDEARRGRRAGRAPDAAMQQPRRRGPTPGQRGQQRGRGAQQESDEPTRPERPAPNRRYDALIDAMAHEIPVRIRADRSEDILNAMEIAAEFGLRIIVEGGAEAHLVAEHLAAGDVPVILDPVSDSGRPRSGMQVRADAAAAAVLEKHGVPWTLGSTGDGRALLISAQQLVAAARVDIDPLELITRRAALMLGIDDRFGRIAPGYQADLVLWDGDPGDPASRVMRVIIAGQTVHEEVEETEDDA